MTTIHSTRIHATRRWSSAILVAASGLLGGCGAPADSTELESISASESEDVKTGTVSQKVVWGISQALLDEHHHWHLGGGRSKTETGKDFLIFHRNFLAKMAKEYRAAGLASANMAPWTQIPSELKTTALLWTPALANAETRIMTNNPPFANEDEFGALVESTIHNWIHGAASTKYNEPALGPIHTSPSSTFFFQIHGMVDLWWSRFLGAKLLQVASSSNISSNWTELNHASLNNRPFARVMATQNWRTSGPYNNHNVGVWFNSGSGRWAIYNEDAAAMTVGAAFNVQIEGGQLTTTAYSGNIGNTYVQFDHPLTTFFPSMQVWAMHNFNPPQATALRNPHATGVWFNGTKWGVFNEDSVTPTDQSFNFLVQTATDASRTDTAFRHTATTANIVGQSTIITNSATDGKSGARLIVTHNWNPTEDSPGTFDNHPIGVWFNGTKWAIFNEDLATMPKNASFNVIVQR